MTDEPGALWITEAEVAQALHIGDAIIAVGDGFRSEARGVASNMLKTFTSWGEHRSTLHAVGATFPERGVVGTKTWAHTEGGANPLLVMFDAFTGRVVAVIEAFALGQLRTAAVSGVATGLLASTTASELGLIGTGKQALAQVGAVVAVRPIRRVRVHGRDEARRAAFADRVRATFDVDVVAAATVEEAVDGAHVITLATRATAPFLRPDMVAPGAHVNAMGAITMARQEFQTALLGRCDVVTTDSVAQVQQLSKEFVDHFGGPDGDWSGVTPLSELVDAGRGRPSDADVTLSKAMGTGICDLAVGLACLDAVRAAGGGRHLDPVRHVAPTLTVPVDTDDPDPRAREATP